VRLVRFLAAAGSPLALVALVALVASACSEPDLRGPAVSSPVVATAVATPEALPTAGPGPTAEPSPPGVSDDVIRVGVIADADAGNAVTGGSEAAWLAMRAWSQAVNDSGGLGGRDVEVVLFDSNVFDHRTAIREACNSDIFALVGSYALFDGDGVDILNEESCRLPDFPAAVLSPARRESAVTFVSNPTSNKLGQAGPARFLSERFPESAASAGTVVLDLPVAFYRAQRDIETATAGGFEFVFQSIADAVGQDYDALAAAMVESGVRAVSWSADGQRFLEFMEAWERLFALAPDLGDAASQGDSGSSGDSGDSGAAASSEAQDIGGTGQPAGQFFFHCSSDCYSQSWAEQVGDWGQDVWVSIEMLPFEEPGDNVELVRYVLYLREEVDDSAELDLIGLSSWASALLFEEAVARAMFASGGGLTRDLVIAAAGTITEWDGRGLHGFTNPAEGIPSPCYILVSPTPSGWIRRHPATAGTMDCEPGNLVELVESATLGLDPGPPDFSGS